MQRVLIIGGTGFVGVHLQRLLQENFRVTATGHDSDIRDSDQTRRLVASTSPDLIINLASITTVRESFANPLETYRIGFFGTLNLLTSLKEIGFKGRMLNISSSEVYGHPSEAELPITEGSLIKPMSPYAVSKLATEALCFQWSQTEQFDIITARPFTHIGPGQSDRFAISNFAKQIAEVMLGRRDPVIRVGNLGATRDFTDVRDVAAAYISLQEKGRNGEIYNICSGNERSTDSLLAELIEQANVDIKIEQDHSLIRDSEQTRIYGSNEKLNRQTGWEPKISLTKTLNDALQNWCEKLK